VVFFLMFTVMFNIVASPFNGLLAEKTQKLLYNSSIPSLSFAQIALRSIKRQGQFLGYFLPRLVIIGILFFIPFIHPIYPIIWFVFAAWMLGMQYQDFAMDNNLISFAEMREKIKNNKMQSLGFGSLINIISFIPLLNILTMPAAVIGSVIMYCEENKIKSEPPLLTKDTRNPKKS
ncbi:MAG: sulfate transporter CysZ, partial [Legionella sp.]|nr:sulfate transporter CysZ [Legionella sp.]